MRIIEFRTQNIKRIKAVAVKPKGSTVVITGRNKQGKTSFMDSIWLLFGGGDASKAVEKTIRNGEKTASIFADIEKFIVERKFWYTKKKELVSKVEITPKDGVAMDKPQQEINKLIGAFMFDPVAFCNLGQREQVDALMKAIGKGDELNLIKEKRKAAYEKRTDENREANRARTEADAIESNQSPDDEPVSTVELANRIEAASELHREQSRVTGLRDDLSDGLIDLDGEISDAKQSLKALEDRRIQHEQAISENKEKIKSFKEPESVDDLRDKLENAESTNDDIRHAKRKQILNTAANGHEAESEKLTEQMDQLDLDKRAIIESAKLPVEGIGFTDDDGITYNGSHMKDWSASEQIEVSMAIAMSLNPELRLIRIMDGSLLDTESMEAIDKMAEDNDYQVWIERVDDDRPGSWTIEDGSLKA